jgi:hypothetical protein
MYLEDEQQYAVVDHPANTDVDDHRQLGRLQHVSMNTAYNVCLSYWWLTCFCELTGNICTLPARFHVYVYRCWLLYGTSAKVHFARKPVR